MRTPLAPFLVLPLALAMAPTLAPAGSADTTGAGASSIMTEGTTTVAIVPTDHLPTPCTGDFCSETGAVTFIPVITDYPPSPCNRDGACTSINVTVPSQ